MSTRPILIVSGTNRPGANALRVSKVIAECYARHGTPAEVVSLSELPLEAFAPEAYATKPPAVRQLQQRVLDAAGLHIVTPEYNGSFPGVLKHFIDLLKYPESFDHRPVAFTGEASGTWGGLRAVEQLQMIFAYRNAHLYPKRVFITGVHGKFDAEGKFNDAELAQRLDEQCAGFAKFATLVQG
jgi:chromate reductase, NAD(P)H dehydrogenase (quinone)